jgi:UPF0271 protein
MTSIDMNADLGEGDPCDGELLTIVSSCNIACGGHAGDESSMRATVNAAIANGVAVGAHPSYPDREGFGRRSHFLNGSELLSSLVGQITALYELCAEEGTTLTHVKPHGALYNDAVVDGALAGVVVRASKEAAPRAALVGSPGSELEKAAARHALRFIAEAFIDRAYLDNGQLVPRSEAGAVHDSIETIAAQAVSLVVNKNVETQSGAIIDVVAETLCIHGDTTGAADAARAVRDALEQQGVDVRAVCGR